MCIYFLIIKKEKGVDEWVNNNKNKIKMCR
jgi:hypothetical protein